MVIRTYCYTDLKKRSFICRTIKNQGTNLIYNSLGHPFYSFWFPFSHLIFNFYNHRLNNCSRSDIKNYFSLIDKNECSQHNATEISINFTRALFPSGLSINNNYFYV